MLPHIVVAFFVSPNSIHEKIGLKHSLYACFFLNFQSETYYYLYRFSIYLLLLDSIIGSKQ